MRFNITVLLAISSICYSKSFFNLLEDEAKSPEVSGSDSSLLSYWMDWSGNNGSENTTQQQQSYWDKYFQSLEDLWDNIYSEIKSYDYKNFSQTIRDEFAENLATIADLREKIRNSMSLSMSIEWKEKYNQAAKALTEMKSNLKLSKLVDKKKLNEKIDELLTSWEEFSVYDLIQRSYKDFIQGKKAGWNMTSNATVGEFLGSVKSSISNSGLSYVKVEEYLMSLHRRDPVCSTKDLACPDGVGKFSAQTCCSSLWLSIGAPLGLGNECWTDLNQMLAQCSVFSCYGVEDGHLNISDGCSLVPDVLLNYDSCVIHDLCYITPGVTKSLCDDFMETNMNTIYCDNVNRYERTLCKVRANVATKALSWTDRYFLASGLARDNCLPSDGLLTRIWKFTLASVSRYV